MRSLLFVLTLLTFATQTFAGTFERQPDLSADELQAFAKESTGLGGTARTFTHGIHEVALVMRSHTSGIRSSDLHVFIHTKGGRYFEVLSRSALWGNHLVATQDGDTIRVTTDPEQRALLDFTISGCFDPQDDRLRGHFPASVNQQAKFCGWPCGIVYSS